MKKKKDIVPDEIREYIMRLNREAPFHRHLDMNITDIKPGVCEAKLIVEEKHMNTMKTAHGGVAFSILDTVSGCAARTMGYKVVTAEMNINYLNPLLKGDEITAVAKVLKAGKRIIVVEGKLFKGNDILSVSRQNLINLGPLDTSSS